jgi:ribose transport system permease protein
MKKINWQAAAFENPYLFALFLLSVVIVVNAILQPNFLEPSTLNGNLRVFLPLILATAGQAIVVLGGGIDVSVGAIVSLVNAILATQIGLQGDPGKGVLIILSSLLIGMAAGAFNGFFVSYLRLQPIITTYATSFLFAGLALFILPSPGGGLPSLFTSFYRDTMPLGIPLAFYVVGLILLVWSLARQTRFGHYLYAVGGQPEAAYETGVPVTSVQFGTYVVSGLMAALGGTATTLLTGSGNAQVGDTLTLSSISAVVIGGVALSGGRGGVAGAMMGAVMLGLVRNIISFADVDTWWQTLVNATLIVIALALPGLLRLRRRQPL